MFNFLWGGRRYVLHRLQARRQAAARSMRGKSISVSRASFT